MRLVFYSFMRIVVCIVLWFCTTSCVWAQSKAIDSLTNTLKQSLPDSKRALVIMNLAIEYENVDTVQAAIRYNEGIVLARNNNLTYETGRLYYNYSYLLSFGGYYNRAGLMLDSALYFLNQSKDPDTEFRLAQVYSTLGNNIWQQGDFKKAIEYRIKSLSLFEKLKKYSSLVVGYASLSANYKEMGDFDKQEEYAFKALSAAQQTKVKKEFFLGYIYVIYALSQKQEYTRAENYLDSAKLSYAPDADRRVMLTYHLIAGLINMNLYEQRLSSRYLNEADEHFKSCYDLAVKYKDAFTIQQSRLQLARILTLRRKFPQSEKELKLILTEVRASHDLNQTRGALDYLSRLYADWGNDKQALIYFKEYKSLSDSIVNIENKKYSTDLEKKYEAEKRETQIKQLETDKQLQSYSIKQKNTLIYIFVGSSVMLVAVFLFAYRDYIHRQRLQQQRITELETEKQLAATEAVLKGEEQERARLAKDLHDGLGGMLSGIKFSLNTMKENLIMTPENQGAFERSIDMLDTSIKEMRRVAHNMMPESLVRFGLDTALSDFCNEITNSGALKVTYQSIGVANAKIPQTEAVATYRIAQELLNNSIRHAEASNVLVQLVKSESTLSLTVEDDGKGFDVNQLKNVPGIGWTNIRHRIDFLKGTYEVHSEVNKGTSVYIEWTLNKTIL